VPLDNSERKLLKTLGANVRRARQNAAMTQEALAEKVGLNPRTVQKIETGSLNLLITTVTRLKHVLGIDWDELLPK
jgi:transcriptional regulator with XRE-family HTH domain